MKRLLYLVPLILIGLSVLPVSVYKDKVDFLLSKDPNTKVKDLSEQLISHIQVAPVDQPQPTRIQPSQQPQPTENNQSQDQ